MAPPGGQTSINLFGGDAEPPQHTVNKCQASRNQSSVFGSSSHEQKVPSIKNPSSETSVNARQAPSNATPPAAPETIPVAVQQPNKPAERPSTKVMAPPGGKTSINLFG